MHALKLFIFLLVGSLPFPVSLFAQQEWPKEIPLSGGGKITIYQPQPESYSGNRLSSRAAVSVRKKSGEEPVFGAIWTEAILLTDKDSRTATLESIKVKDAKFPGVENAGELQGLKETIENEVPKWNLEISLEEIVATLQQQSGGGSDNLSNDPPTIIYTTNPSALITIDGEPILEQDKDIQMQKVTNSPFLIVQNPDDKKYYLYGGKFWYQSAAVANGWKPVSTLPRRIKALDDAVKKQEKENAEKEEQDKNETPKQPAKKPQPPTPPAIIVSTKPAELIQSDGEAQYRTVEGTGLLYVSNSDNDIFKDINSQDNYIVVSGRWYKSPSLKSGDWTYVEPDRLPADFSKIPEGSDKDVVLANIAGTDAAREAVLDASIPQTAKVDRKTATTSVQYDGSPEFESIEGTDMKYAVNTPSSVIFENARYYAVDNGVWFESDNPNGPWRVSEQRPADIDRIPANNPVYNTRYVYIYDATPDYIYMGYTPGYLGCYVYGPTVVYGTGWRYRPWYRRYYYARPLTWGFGMHYNPWTGFNMGFGFSTGFFSFSYGSGSWLGWHGGWWGPPAYRPPYRPPYWARGNGGWHGGYYGSNRRSVTVNNNITIINNRTTNNLYRNNRGVITRDVNRRPNQSLANRPLRPGANGPGGNRLPPGQVNPGTRPGNRLPETGVVRPTPGNRLPPDQVNPATRPGNRLPPVGGNTGTTPGSRLPGNDFDPVPSNRLPDPIRSREANDVITDRGGNVYQRNTGGGFQQRDRSGWKPATRENAPGLQQVEREQQLRERSNMRINNFDQGRTGGFSNRPTTSPTPQVRTPVTRPSSQNRPPVARPSTQNRLPAARSSGNAVPERRRGN